MRKITVSTLFSLGIAWIFLGCGSGNQAPKQEHSWQRTLKFNTFLEKSIHQPLDSSRHALDTLIAFYKDDSTAFRHLVGSLSEPLSDPNSQVRNEELYIPVLEALIASPFYDSTEKIRPEYRLRMARKNRVGQPANDFTYTLANGKKGTLYELSAPFILVYFNNPDCNACREIKEEIVGSKFLEKAIDSGRLKILALYPDEDLTAWKNNLKEMPAEWLNGYDAEQAMRDEELYDLRAIPSMYLLDSEKKVLLKDLVSVAYLEHYLSQQQ